MIARWIGAAPRQRGSRLAWMFRQPCARRVEHRLRQDQAIGDDDADIGPERGEVRLRLGRFQADRVPHGQAQRLGPHLHGARAVLLAAPGGSRRLAIDAGDLVPRIDQRVQRPGRRNPGCP
jgi:hypothetical protein